MLDLKPAVAVSLFLAAFQPTATAQCPSPAQLAAGDAIASDDVGSAVSVSGLLALVGASRHDVGGHSLAGAAYLFERQGGAWVEVAQLTADDNAPNDRFGISVSLDGGRALVGAYQSDPGGVSSAGAAYLFERQAGNWVQVAKLTASDANESALFGLSVSIQGDRALVGALGALSPVLDPSGAAYVFELQGASWVETAKITASDAEANDLFGSAVALSGDTALVGAFAENADDVPDKGSAYVFENGGGGWVETAKLNGSDTFPFDRFGYAVALAGDIGLIGAHFHDADGVFNAGAAYVFERGPGGWAETAKLQAAVPEQEEYFGWAVARSGLRALVGAPLVDGAFDDEGTAYLFELSGDTWIETDELVSPAPADADRLGWSTALAPGTALVGAVGADVAGVSTGAAWAYDLDGCVVAYCFCAAGAPCDNTDPNAGCANSSGSGGLMFIQSGSTGVGADDLVLGASGVLPLQPGLFYQGNQALNLGLGIPFGDGLRCVGQNVIRLETVTPDTGGGASTTISIAAKGGVAPGDLKRYQFWYRDPIGSPCGELFNLTNALEITWAP